MSDVQALYSAGDVARIFGLKESRVRYWAQTGFINPTGARAGKRLYTFRDLVAIRAAVELLDHGIPLQRVRRNLHALREALPEVAQPLAELRICSNGEELLVLDPSGARYEPVSGQLMLDFQVDALRSQVVELLEAQEAPGRAGRDGPDASPAAARAGDRGPGSAQEPSTAYGWFLQGCACDRDSGAEELALTSYRRAVELDPGLAPALTNLGNLHYRRGEREEARRCYQSASDLEPDQPEARYNLANLYDEDGDLEMAIAEYRRALALDPDFADAHFNLAATLERSGSGAPASTHWRRYVELAEADPGPDPEGPAEWLRIAREHLIRGADC